MKYKNIELIASKDSETELLCNVDFKNIDSDDDLVDDMEDSLISLFKNFKNQIEIETVSDETILVRCWEISFDEKGVEILKSIYDKLVEAKLEAAITVGVHVDGEWFIADDGHKYNQDDVTYEEFLKHIEY